MLKRRQQPAPVHSPTHSPRTRLLFDWRRARAARVDLGVTHALRGSTHARPSPEAATPEVMLGCRSIER
eukprot:scaffold66234_cov62-Phaeocystis_antarctica.AAC.6